MNWQLVVGWLFCVSLVNGIAEEPEKTYADFYEWGREAYTEERWYDCVAFMKRALEDYKYERSILLHCQKKCERLITAWDSNSPPDSELKYFDRVVKKALCLDRCKVDQFGPRPMDPASRAVAVQFENLEPYSFMQFCYWKLDDLEHAIHSAYTYLNRNPDDQMMSENIQFYTNQAKYNSKMLKDLEIEEYQTLYIEGANAHDAGNYIEVIDKIERSLQGYWHAVEDCRLIAQSASEPLNDNPAELYVALAKHYTDVLRSKVNCSRKTKYIRGNYIADLVPSMFHYLQYSYWKKGEVRKACQAVGSYMVFYPEDETMIYNKDYFKQNYAVQERDFAPRRNVLEYYRRDTLERRLLLFVKERYKMEDDVYPSEHPDDLEPLKDDIPEFIYLADAVEEAEQFSRAAAEKSKGDLGALHEISQKKAPSEQQQLKLAATANWQPSNATLASYESEFGIKVVKKEQQLNGSLRFLASNVLSEEECKTLMSLQDLAEPGSGYSGKISPHTAHEAFQGLATHEISELAVLGKVQLGAAKLFLDKSELAREFTQAYFNLSSHLYFHYTQFVCREAKSDMTVEGRNDFSHPIHGDNCMLKNDRCVKEFPAYVWRDYSALVYLNGDFEGGQLVFTDVHRNSQAELKPGCGQMVGFVGDTLHGVKAVLKGTRCVMALWMTLDQKYEEPKRIKAQQLLAQLEWEGRAGAEEDF